MSQTEQSRAQSSKVEASKFLFKHFNNFSATNEPTLRKRIPMEPFCYPAKTPLPPKTKLNDKTQRPSLYMCNGKLEYFWSPFLLT